MVYWTTSSLLCRFWTQRSRWVSPREWSKGWFPGWWWVCMYIVCECWSVSNNCGLLYYCLNSKSKFGGYDLIIVRNMTSVALPCMHAHMYICTGTVQSYLSTYPPPHTLHTQVAWFPCTMPAHLATLMWYPSCSRMERTPTPGTTGTSHHSMKPPSKGRWMSASVSWEREREICTVSLTTLRFYPVLLQHGADAAIRNSDGKTALDLAEPTAKLVLSGDYKKDELLEAARTGNEEVLMAFITPLNVNCHADDGRKVLGCLPGMQKDWGGCGKIRYL